jgi:HupE / UreJ protein
MNSSFVEGILHITDLGGYDHMLFLLTLIAGYTWTDWKKILWLITAFTIGHATTLICAGMGWISFSSNWIEFLISATIFATALFRLISPSLQRTVDWKTYAMVAFFGLIHGVGFSTFFKMMYSNTGDMILELLKFNLGVETGQIIVVGLILLLFAGLYAVLKTKKEWVARLVLSLALVLSAFMVWEKWLGL